MQSCGSGGWDVIKNDLDTKYDKNKQAIENVCPACGANINDKMDTCPECGISFR